MKCIHCKETINKNEPKCSKCGKEIDEAHWSVKLYRTMMFIMLAPNVILMGSGILMGMVGVADMDLEGIRGNKKLAIFFVASVIICLAIQVSGVIVHYLTSRITLYALYVRKWNGFIFFLSILPSILYGYNMAFILWLNRYDDYNRMGMIISAAVLLFSVAMFLVSLAGAKRIKAKERAYKKIIKEKYGKNDEELIDCGGCGADLPKGVDVCPVCGRKIDLREIGVPENLSIWCAALSFCLMGARRRKGEDPIFVGNPKERLEDMIAPSFYLQGDYTLPAETTKSYMFEFGGASVVWSLVICLISAIIALGDTGGVSWVESVGGFVRIPVYWFTIIACVAVIFITSFKNRNVVKAINYKEWDNKIEKDLKTALIIRLCLSAVLIICMTFIDFRVILTIPIIVFLIGTQLALMSMSKLVKKRIELFHEYRKQLVSDRPLPMKINSYKNSKYNTIE